MTWRQGEEILVKKRVCYIAPVNVFLSGYSSRKRSPDGDWNNATGTLTQLDHPGHFSQELVFGDFEGPAVDYNVVWLDEETAIE